MFADVDGDASKLERAERANRASNVLTNKQDRGTKLPINCCQVWRASLRSSPIWAPNIMLPMLSLSLIHVDRLKFHVHRGSDA